MSISERLTVQHKPDVQHDTPPPITLGTVASLDNKKNAFVLEGGSAPGLSAESLSSMFRAGAESGGHPPSLGHIKIVDGSGEILYRNNKAEMCQIRVVLDGGPESEFRIGGFPITVKLPDRCTVVPGTGTDKPTSKKRAVRYRMIINGSEQRMTELKVVELTQNPDFERTLFHVELDELPEAVDHDIRVMIWLHHGHNHVAGL